MFTKVIKYILIKYIIEIENDRRYKVDKYDDYESIE